ncbi:MAG: DUF4861 family protein [Bacteroidota bacterium]|nr:DUF4861 family protein [Bacteroidota bacterium]
MSISKTTNQEANPRGIQKKHIFNFNVDLEFLNWLPMSIKCLSTAFLILGLAGCSQHKEKTLTQISLTNPEDISLTDKAVAIALEKLEYTASKNYPLLTLDQDTIASQLSDMNADGTADHLFFVMDFEPKEAKKIQLEWVAEAPQYDIKTSIRFGKREAKDQPVQPALEETLSAQDMPKALGFQKYQTDGPTWENDKVAFRHYLDGRNAKDVYGKKTAAISPENVGLDSSKAVVDNYHTMEAWGRDVFPVGNSAGLGGFGIIAKDSIRRLGILVTDTLSNVEQTHFKIIEEGAVKSTMHIDYTNWNTAGNTYHAEETTSIWPGMYAYQNTVSVAGLQQGDTLAIGLSNINNKNGVEELTSEKWVALIQHDSLTYDRKWIMGSALILPAAAYQNYAEAPSTGNFTQSYLAKLNVGNDTPVTYYGVSGWELSQEPKFKDAAYFKSYVEQLANQLYTEIDIQIEN